MQKIRIDETFKNLINAPSREEKEQLEQNIIKEGCRDSLVIWNDILIDGHNRYEICTRNNIEFKTITMEFDTREDVMDWIINNQLGRRNLTDSQRSYLRGLQYTNEKKKAGGDRKSSVQKSHLISETSVTTAERLGKQHQVDESTIRRDAQFATAVDLIGKNVGVDVKEKILTREITVPKKEVIKIANLPKEQQKNVFNQTDNKVNLNNLGTKKVCATCGELRSPYDFYSGSKSCRDCDNTKTRAKRPMRDAAGRDIKIDRSKLIGIDLDAIERSVKSTDKSNVVIDYEIEYLELSANTSTYLVGINKYIVDFEKYSRMDNNIKIKFKELLNILEEKIIKIKSNLKGE